MKPSLWDLKLQASNDDDLVIRIMKPSLWDLKLLRWRTRTGRSTIMKPSLWDLKQQAGVAQKYSLYHEAIPMGFETYTAVIPLAKI